MLNRLKKKILKLKRTFRRRTMSRNPLLSQRTGNTPIVETWKRCAVSPGREYVYVRLPKCANSTIIRTLAHYDPAVQEDPDDEIGMYAKKQFASLDVYGKIGLNEFLSKTFVFTFVRNPYHRLLSAYLDKIRFGQDLHSDFSWVAKAVGAETASSVPFPDFVAFLEQNGLFRNPHWAPQTDLFPFPATNFNFIGRVEQLQTDLSHVITYLFPGTEWTGAITRKHNRTNAAGSLHEYYTPGLPERVYSLYQNDFETFGYDKVTTDFYS